MFTVIEMRNHRDDSADFPSFCHRRTCEYRNISVTSEIGRTADTIHHLRTRYMRTAHISENIGFQCRIDRDKPHTAYQLGVIAYLAGAQHDFIPEKVEVAIHFLHHFIAYRQRTTAGESTTTFPQKSDDRVLYHLGIHLERRNIGIAAQETRHGVGDVSYH